MTANQRRPGFRLPWSSEDEPQGGAVRTEQPSVTGQPTPSTSGQPTPGSAEDERPSGASSDEQPGGAAGAEEQPSDRAETDEAAAEPGGRPAEGSAAAEDAESTATAQAPKQDAAAESEGELHAPGAGAADAAARTDGPQTGASGGAEEGPEATAGTGFMHELVEAMRRVADEARQTRLAEARSEADAEIREIEAEAERRRNELRAQAEADIAGVGEWAKAEAERIRTEAEQRVAARRAELERQLTAESAHGEARAGVLRARVSEYERELQAFHAKLSEIQDPAAFAAAVKRMPRRAGEAPPEEADEPAAAADEPAAPADEPAAPAADTAMATAAHADGDNGVSPTPDAEDDRATMQATQAETLAAPRGAEQRDYASAEPTFTEIVVKGLGSFGAITGFRQQLASVPGVDAVGLSLGTTGEFIFKTTHTSGFDIANAIRGLEGDAVSIEQRPEGGLRVTLDRPR